MLGTDSTSSNQQQQGSSYPAYSSNNNNNNGNSSSHNEVSRKSFHHREREQNILNATAAPPAALPEMDPSIHDYDGEFYCKKIDINEIRNRYVVTRPEMQSQIEQQTGTKVETRGKFYPDRRLATDRDPSIHLFLTAPSLEALTKAIDIIRNELTKALDFLAGNLHSLWPEVKVVVGIETGSVNFSLRLKLVGQNGVNVKYITNETGARVQLRGRGSMYKEANGLEADEPLYIHVTAPTYEGLEKARTLTESLVSTIKAEFEQTRAMAAYGMYAAYYSGYPEASAVDSSSAADPYAAYYAQYGYNAGAAGGYDYSGYYAQQGYAQPPDQSSSVPPPPPEDN